LPQGRERNTITGRWFRNLAVQELTLKSCLLKLWRGKTALEGMWLWLKFINWNKKVKNYIMLVLCETFHNEWCMSSKSKIWSSFKIMEGKQKKSFCSKNHRLSDTNSFQRCQNDWWQ
jgi:hypothetical protein